MIARKPADDCKRLQVSTVIAVRLQDISRC